MIQTYTTKLTAKKQLIHDTWQFQFTLVEPKTLEFVAGQYLILHIGDKGYRNYSIASPKTQNNGFDLIIQMFPQGLASTYLMELQPGATVQFRGPAGKFTLRENNKNKIFLATGTGIAPIKSMIETALNSKYDPANGGTNFYLFWGLRTCSDVYHLDTLKNFSKELPNFKFKICLSREENIDDLETRYFSRGRVNPNLLQFFGVQSVEQARLHAALLNSFDYYLCGGRDVVESLRIYVSSLGILGENIYFEKF